MPPKSAVTEAAPNVYRDSLLGLSLDMALRELIANQGLKQFICCTPLCPSTQHLCFAGLPSDFRDIVLKEFDAQVSLQFSQLATKRKWSISGDISTYKNNIFWQVNCHPVKVTLFGEPAQVCALLLPCPLSFSRELILGWQEAVNGIQMISYEKRDP